MERTRVRKGSKQHLISISLNTCSMNMKTDSQDHNPEHQVLLLIDDSIQVRGFWQDFIERVEVIQ